MTLRPGELQGILQQMYEANNSLTPQLVVTEAADVDHPLHHRFDWNDATAAHKHRLSQAADLIRSVRVTYAERPDGSEKSVRAFVTPRGPDVPTGTYKPVEEVMSDPIQARILLRDAKREAEAFRRRYGHLEEFATLVQGMSADTA